MDRQDDFNNLPAQHSNYSTVLLIFTIPIAIIAAFVAWSYLSCGDDLSFDIEWKFWRSTFLWPALSFIGFFLQFIDWQHTSFREGWVVKDSWGREKFVANDDIMSVLWGHSGTDRVRCHEGVFCRGRGGADHADRLSA